MTEAVITNQVAYERIRAGRELPGDRAMLDAAGVPVPRALTAAEQAANETRLVQAVAQAIDALVAKGAVPDRLDVVRQIVSQRPDLAKGVDLWRVLGLR